MPEKVNGKVPEDLGMKPETSLSSFWRILLRRSTVFVLILVFLGNSVTESEWLKEQLPFIAVFEMTIHRCMSRLDPRPKPARYVTIVSVDDDAHYSPPLSGAKPTRRSYLATLLVNPISSDPMVVAIDFRLLKQSPTAEDSELLKAIRTANARRIAVVLVDWVPDGYQEAANIFSDSDVGPLTTFGLANLPTDARKIPLQSTILRSDGKELVKRKSFPLAVVEAYDNDTEALVPTAAETHDSGGTSRQRICLRWRNAERGSREGNDCRKGSLQRETGSPAHVPPSDRNYRGYVAQGER